jgi:hypothetical protein
VKRLVKRARTAFQPAQDVQDQQDGGPQDHPLENRLLMMLFFNAVSGVEADIGKDRNRVGIEDDIAGQFQGFPTSTPIYRRDKNDKNKSRSFYHQYPQKIVRPQLPAAGRCHFVLLISPKSDSMYRKPVSHT